MTQTSDLRFQVSAIRTVPSPDADLSRTRASVRQVINRYQHYLQMAQKHGLNARDEESARLEMQALARTLKRLDSGIFRVAVFGLVSRGKSAVLNALMGQKILPTGPLNGVTLEPRSLRWSPNWELPTTQVLEIELVDTPGLDEIDGQTRARMAGEIAQQSDLILFVVAGDITRTEYQALCDLRQAQKPLILVFNKIDLYPEQSRQAIYQNLQQMAAKSQGSDQLQQLLSAHEIVLVAAAPAPLQVRVESLDGQIHYEWETPEPDILELKKKIVAVLQQEGSTLMALNALVQATTAEKMLAQKLIDLHQAAAEDLIWKFVRYKAIAVAVNPIAVLDVAGGTLSDIIMIQALANLYHLPLTRHNAGKLWKTILTSSGSLLAGQFVGGLVLGIGKTATAAASGLDGSTSFSALATVGVLQGAIAGYGAYAVGRAVQVYLEQGCSWGPQGPNRVIQDILNQLEPKTIIYRLRQELSQDLGIPGL